VQPGIADADDDDFTRAHAFMDATILANIRQRKQQAQRDDFLGQLLTDGVLEGNPFTEQELLDQTKTMLVAGHDSVAHSIVFALYFLSTHPTWQDRVRAEGQCLASNQSLTEVAATMKQTEAVALETLRLMPAIWSNERRAMVDDEIDGWPIPRGSTVVLSPYIVHRHPKFWEQPSDFIPERFLSAQPLSHRYSYFPFGGGQRTCIGNNLAIVQLKVALGTLLNQFRIELAPEFKYGFNHMVVLRFMNGLPLKLIPL
jgi:cytochrome P450